MKSRGTTNIQQRGVRFQLRVTHPELTKPRFFTFASREAAEDYRQKVDAWFASGQVPPELMTYDSEARTPLLVDVIRAYERSTEPPPAPSELPLLVGLVEEVKGKRVADITFQWASEYVQGLKVRKLAPGTIRKRVDLLARVLDHHHRSEHRQAAVMPANVLRLLPRGYSLYADNAVADTSRDVRLTEDQHARILATLMGMQREDRQRPWGNIAAGEAPDPSFRMLYLLIVDTGMRLREAYTARVGDLDVEGRFLRVRGSKGHRGKIKWRTVPLKRVLYDELVAWCHGRDAAELLLPFWSGDEADAKRCQLRLTGRFKTLFAYADVPDFTEHDLRHEACCRWVSLKDKDGRWMFTDSEICRVMGWSDPRLMLRYMSLRGEDLSARLH
ncbi:MAG: hypothetical protein EOO29_11445 [Comamonadaceae bacterium]|nr:MAG: hypothetical protein EOO29_11445 [Comamonadaceae bacterium]